MRYLWNFRCFSRWTGLLVFDSPGDNPMTPQCSHPDDSHVYAAENSGSLPYMEEVYPQVAPSHCDQAGRKKDNHSKN